MKNLITIAILCMLAFGAFAQNTNTYEYDNLNRLTKVTYANGAVVEYTYDAVGNRLTKVVTGADVNYTITATADPTAGGSVTGGGTYQQGQNCTLTATANSGYTFTNWTENSEVVSTEATYSFTVTGDRNVVANFEEELNLPIPTDGLIAYYPFNGNANDESGNGNHGTLKGNVPQLTNDRFGNENSAYLFGGYNNKGWIRVPNSSSLALDNALSISFWVNFTDFGGMNGWGNYTTDNNEHAVVCKGGDNSGHPGFNAFLKPTGDSLYVGSFNKYPDFYGVGVYYHGYAPGQWLHCVVTVEDTLSRLYINGNLYQESVGDPANFSNANTQDMTIGVMNAGSWYPFNGKIDDVILYNRALSPQEVQMLYNFDEDLVAYYPFDGDVNDYSGNGNHGTIIGNVVPATDRHGNPNGAYRFPGEAFNYISVPDAEILHLNSFTLSAWVYSDADDYGSGYLINKGRDITTGSYRLCVKSVGATTQYNGTNDSGINEVPELGQWHMVTGTVEGDQARYYLDGVLMDERTLSRPFSYNNSNPLTLGCHYYSGVPSTWAFTLLGVLDEVRIYNRVLSPIEVQMLYGINLIEITAIANPTGGGTITGAGTYNHGQTCTLTATANEGYTFVNWTENGEVVSTDATYSFVVSDDRSLVANFVLPFTISAIANPSAGGTVTGGSTYDYGSTCTLTATANEGYSFVNWTENGEVVSYLSTYSFTVTENTEYVAHFEETPGTNVGTPEATNVYLPSYSFFKYTLSQQIYTPDEIGTTGFISTLSYFNAGATKTRNFDIYMVHTDKTVFDSNSDWITVTEADRVFSGDVTMGNGYWTSIVLDTPFAYNGISNLAIIIDDNSRNWTSSPHMACRTFNTTGNQAIRVYSDGTDYDPYNPLGYNGTLHSEKNQIILGFLSTRHFITAGNWSTASNWQDGAMPRTIDEAFIDAPCQLNQNATVAVLTVSDGQSLTLQSGKTLTVTNTFINTATTGLIIEDGAQLVHASENVSATVKKSITGHGTNRGKYSLISNPLATTVNPELASIYHLTRGNYDLYDWLPNTPDNLEWRNYKDNDFMMLPDGYGYLYANQNGVELSFPGTLKPSNNRLGKSVSYDSNDTEHPGWNLIGNPFMCNAYLVNGNNEPLPYYRMNAAGNGFEAVAPGTPIAPMEGVFYKASGNEVVYFISTDSYSDTHEYVDLGLPSGLLWATCNVGADSPEDYGDYFAWGETEPKDTYNLSTYQYCMGNYNTLTKYCSNSSYGYNGFTDNLTTLLPEDDAATANWGSDWRIPTKEEWQELYQNTTHTWTTQNGVNGRLFTAANGNSLFLPAAGDRWDDELYYAGSDGGYWSSSLYTDYPYGAWGFDFGSYYTDVDGNYRDYGLSVRAVRSARQN